MSDGQRAAERPNVVMVVADDLGWGDLGCYGATGIPTPAIDGLAAEGVRAVDCHAASAVCTPSRYALLTGRYAWRGPLKRRVLSGHSPAIIESGRPTMASILKETGYRTAAFGKWHLGLDWRYRDGRIVDAFAPGTPLVAEVDDGSTIDYRAGFGGGPTALGFDRFFGIAGALNMPPFCFLDQDRPAAVPDMPKKTYHGAQRRGLQSADWDDRLVDVSFAAEAVNWLSSHGTSPEPFFCYVATSAPHRPCLPPEMAQGKSGIGPRGDLVWLVDWVVERILHELARLGVAERTLVIVTSDNGAHPTQQETDLGHRANGRWRGQKADIWEGGHRVPFLARWPGVIPAGSVTDRSFGLVDLVATVAAAAGAPLPSSAAEDSADRRDILTGLPAGQPDRQLVLHSADGTFGLRSGRWMLIMGSGSGGFSEPFGEHCRAAGPSGQLYDLVEDPRQSVNRWDGEPGVVAALYRDLKHLVRGVDSGLCFDVPLGAPTAGTVPTPVETPSAGRLG